LGTGVSAESHGNTSKAGTTNGLAVREAACTRFAVVPGRSAWDRSGPWTPFRDIAKQPFNLRRGLRCFQRCDHGRTSRFLDDVGEGQVL